MDLMGASQRNVAASRAVFLAVVRFVVYFVALFSAIVFVAALGGTVWLQEGLARLAARFISLSGVWAVAAGPAVYLANRALAIDLACTAVFVAALYSAMVLAYPVRWQSRLLGVAIGVPAILVANVARLVAGAHVSSAMPAAFGFVHDYLFQVGMILLTVALWLGWLAYARSHAR